MEYNFDAKGAIKELVAWIRDWFDTNGGEKAIIGISGGKDSSVAAALCVEALGKDKVIGVTMPNGEQSDYHDSILLINHLGIEHIDINIKDAVVSIENAIGDCSEQTRINLPPRIRMSALYAVSQSNKGRVVNTCNASENYVGYSTKWGDNVGDFSLFGRLTTYEIVKIGIELGLPDHLVYKTPSDGLCGKTDEDNLGVTYRDINRILRCYEMDQVSEETVEKINEMYDNSRFKEDVLYLPTFVPSLKVLYSKNKEM